MSAEPLPKSPVVSRKARAPTDRQLLDFPSFEIPSTPRSARSMATDSSTTQSVGRRRFSSTTASAHITLSITQTEDHYAPGGQKRFTVYLVNCTVVLPVLVHLNQSAGSPRNKATVESTDLEHWEQHRERGVSAMKDKVKRQSSNFGAAAHASPSASVSSTASTSSPRASAISVKSLISRLEHNEPKSPKSPKVPSPSSSSSSSSASSSSASTPASTVSPRKPSPAYNNTTAVPALLSAAELKSDQELLGKKKKVFVIPKRYSEFVSFHQLWRKQYREFSKVHFELPQKKWWNNFQPEVIEKRRESLEKYIQQLALIPVLAVELFKFLGIEKDIEPLLPEAPEEHEKLFRHMASRHTIEEVKEETQAPPPKRPPPGGAADEKEKLKAKALDPTAKRRPSLVTLAKRRSQQLKMEAIRKQMEDAANANEDDENADPVSESRARSDTLLGDFEPVAMPWRQLALIHAISDGNLDGVKLALHNDFDINSPLGYHRRTAIEWAVYKQQEAIADYLLSQGAVLHKEVIASLQPPIAARIGIKEWDFAPST